MNKVAKKFDAVAMMREARDRISGEIEGMTLQQELDWLASREIDDAFLRRLREKIATTSQRRNLKSNDHSS